MIVPLRWPASGRCSDAPPFFCACILGRWNGAGMALPVASVQRFPVATAVWVSSPSLLPSVRWCWRRGSVCACCRSTVAWDAVLRRARIRMGPGGGVVPPGVLGSPATSGSSGGAVAPLGFVICRSGDPDLPTPVAPGTPPQPAASSRSAQHAATTNRTRDRRLSDPAQRLRQHREEAATLWDGAATAVADRLEVGAWGATT